MPIGLGHDNKTAKRQDNTDDIFCHNGEFMPVH